MPIRRLIPAALTGALLGLSAPAAAQYAIDWYSIDGGAGTGTGGTYSLSGTVGQPDAGVMVGGPYMLVGGFWGVADPPADFDFDGKPDSSETLVVAQLMQPTTNTSVQVRDSDGDGLIDGEENPSGKTVTRGTTALTDPRNPDSDNDGWLDGLEVRYPGTFPNGPLVADVMGLTDADGDGVPAGLDPNDALVDSDGDGYLDGYEFAVGSDPASALSVPGMGDVDNDGDSDVDDVALLANLLLGNATLSAPWNADLSVSATLDLSDLTTLANLRVLLTTAPQR